MKIVLIGPGTKQVPPVAWGAVESLLADWEVELHKQKCQVTIVNTSDRGELIERVNVVRPDVVHYHADRYLDTMQHIRARFFAVTPQYAYYNQRSKWHDAYRRVLTAILSAKSCHIFAVSDSMRSFFVDEGVAASRISVLPNSARPENISFSLLPSRPTRTLYLARVEPRKRQHLLQNKLLGLDFVGPQSGPKPYPVHSDYLGEWSKSKVFQEMTSYPNLALLSDGEAHSLACVEAMMAGLGLVVSEYASANLDPAWTFVDVVQEKDLLDMCYLEKVLASNRVRSITQRSRIRQLAVERFGTKQIIERYLREVDVMVRSSGL